MDPVSLHSLHLCACLKWFLLESRFPTAGQGNKDSGNEIGREVALQWSSIPSKGPWVADILHRFMPDGPLGSQTDLNLTYQNTSNICTTPTYSMKMLTVIIYKPLKNYLRKIPAKGSKLLNYSNFIICMTHHVPPSSQKNIMVKNMAPKYLKNCP